MNFTLNQLRIFVQIVEEKNITKAAEKLFLTQPAVSIQLKNFQEQFEIPLTEVINKRIYITDFGLEIANAAKLILNEVNEINYKRGLYEGKLTGKLKISVVSTGKYVIPFFLTDFLNENPEVELILDVSNRESVIGNLEANEVDFVLLTRLPNHLEIEAIELMKNKLVMVGAKGSNTEFQSSLRNEKNKKRYIFRELGSETRQAMENYLKHEQIMAQKTLTLTSNEAVKQAVISGMGYSIVPLIGINNELVSGQLEIIKAKNLPILTTGNIVHLKQKKLSPVAKAYKNFLINNLNQLVSKHFNSTNL